MKRLKAWALKTPDNVVTHCIRSTRRDVQLAAANSLGREWWALKDRGYTVVRIVITEAAP